MKITVPAFGKCDLDSNMNGKIENNANLKLIKDKKRIWSIYIKKSKNEATDFEGDDILNSEDKKNPKTQKKSNQIEWTEEEEDTLFNLHKIYGNKWSKISNKIPGKDKNAVKNCFYCKMRKTVRMLNCGIVNDRIRNEIHCTKESIYLLEHIRNNYFDTSDKKLDKYVKEMIISNQIKKSSIDKYIELILKSVEPEIQQNIQLKQKVKLPKEVKSIKIDGYTYEESLSEINSKNSNFTLPIPFNMFNPRFILNDLEGINYKLLFKL